MENIYLKHKDVITKLFHDKDIPFILIDPLRPLFNDSAILRIESCKVDSVNVFFQEFDDIQIPLKYNRFIEVTTDVSEWIAALLIATDDGDLALHKYNTSYALINEYTDFFVNNLEFAPSLLLECQTEQLISARSYDLLMHMVATDGDTLAINRLHSLLHVRSTNCYSKFLYLCCKHNQIYLEMFCPNLFEMIRDCTTEEEKRCCIDVIASSNLDLYNNESGVENVVIACVESSPCSNVSEYQSRTYEPKDSSFNDPISEDEDSDSNIDLDDLFGEAQNKLVREMINFQPETIPTEPVSLKMRQYQDELTKRGIEGKNVLICAPTSSGKTVVAIKITEEHMKLNVTGKVAFVVPTTVLVDQQFNLFRKYLGKNYKINKLTGGTKSFSVPFSKQIEDYDILVFTCDILRNSLEDQDEPLETIGEFTLLIFDECHHCDKDHSYNKVMDHYFKDKQRDRNVPQIIGMTASTGTNKASNVQDALKNLFSLCANLDCGIVSTVSINKVELEENLPSPSSGIVSPGSRAIDHFEESLLVLMDTIEGVAHAIFRANSKPIGFPPDRYHDKYLSFVKGITNYYPNKLSEEDRRTIKIIEIYLENLYRALIINHLFHCCHAIDMLKEKIERNAPCTCDVETRLRGLLNNFLSSASHTQDINPSLESLKFAIVTQIREDRKSKIIIFVKEVNYTRILETEIKRANLGFIECKALVGTNKSSDQGGLSKSETENIVSRFKQGYINLLFATSVAEEGLDVEKCNLVVRYGHVTNEIAMVQSRGRARAKDSKYIVIVPDKLKWQVNKENINKVRESMMYLAIEQFQRMDLDATRRELFECQEKRHALRNTVPSNSVAQPVPRTSDNTGWSMHCIKCEQYICSAEDIRLANGTSYIIVNKDTYCNLQMKSVEKNNHPLVCVKCQSSLGYVIKVTDINVPTVKINQCILIRGEDTKKPKKWKDAPFNVAAVSSKEMNNCHNDVYIW